MPGKDEEIKYGQKRLPPWFEFLADYDKTLEYYASKPEYYLAQYLEDVAKPSYITDKSISSKDSGSSITWQHEVTGADRLLVISVAYANEHHLDNAPGLTGVKYGTTALTFIRRDSYGGFVTELWYLKNPPLGKKNVVATFPANNSFGGIVATGTTFVGVDQTNPIRRNVGGGSTDTSLPQYGGHPSLDVPGQPGDYIYASLNIFAGEDNAVTREGNTAGLWGRVHGDIYSKGGIQKATSTSTTMEWLSSKHWQWAMSGIAIKPKSTTTPTPTPTPSPTVSPTATPAPNGLIGRYYDNINFTALKLTRTDPRIAFNWKTGTPNSKLAANTFSVRWTGFIKAPVTGKYTFYAQVNDGVRVWVNKTRIINSWTNKTATTQVTGTINLTKGQKYPIRVDYYENTASALINLYWAYPGVTKRIIPTSVLTTK
jgi:hypothetical protein